MDDIQLPKSPWIHLPRTTVTVPMAIPDPYEGQHHLPRNYHDNPSVVLGAQHHKGTKSEQVPSKFYHLLRLGGD